MPLVAGPQDAEAANRAGMALHAQGRLDEAMAMYRIALAAKPDDADVHVNLGGALAAKGELDEAIACFQRALALKPSSVPGLINLGNALCEQGRHDEAIPTYARALAIQPAFPVLRRHYQPRGVVDGSPDRHVARHANGVAANARHAIRARPRATLVSRRGSLCLDGG